MPTVAETIREATRQHLLERKGLLFGQCVTAVGWIGGTVPELTEDDGIVELPTSDVAGPGFAVGAALAGRRPIFVCRYQGFMWYNAASIVNYAAKSMEMWGRPCPLFVRAIAMEGGIGPVAGGSHHSMIMHMPGIKVCAPMTPQEWLWCWNDFLASNHPVYCSEHRLSYNLTDLPDVGILAGAADVVLIGISAGRLSAAKAIPILHDRGFRVDLHHVNILKPYSPHHLLLDALKNMGSRGLAVVIDSDYATCGTAEHVAHRLMLATGRRVHALGLADRTAGFAAHLDNKTPSPNDIVNFVESELS